VVGQYQARNFGLALAALTIVVLIAGLFSHMGLVTSLRERRARLLGLKLVHSGPQYRNSPTAIAAGLLLLIGLMAIFAMVWRAGRPAARHAEPVDTSTSPVGFRCVARP
jgi:hypothetical protein